MPNIIEKIYVEMELCGPKYGSFTTTKQLRVYKSSMNVLSHLKVVEFQMLPCVSPSISKIYVNSILKTMKNPHGKNIF